ncbi:hypothetical protein ACHHYP_15227 [Achlya hypogyna]|uniref:Uncharacterized protein n=1 Tax=Achlya hypogyna TaxID=1202772 RepID=A0A1V9YBA3_ACHHY|nr:hypothetical protein ACHHYP_15227 [Achlya hypogyna]
MHVDCDLAELVPLTKRVAFSTATTYEFEVAYGGSAIPGSSGPPIGMTRDHFTATTTELSETDDSDLLVKCVRKFEHLERIDLLKRAGCPVRDIAIYCLEAMEVRNSRSVSVELYRKRKLESQQPWSAKRLPEDHAPRDLDASMACMLQAVDCLLGERRPKRVAFSTATTYTFAVAYGGSALPKESGPPIGLARKHSATSCLRINDLPRSGAPSRVRKFDHLERIALLKNADYDVREIASFCLEAVDLRKSRSETNEAWTALRRKRKLEQANRKSKRRCSADETPVSHE